MSNYVLWRCRDCCNALLKLNRPKSCECGNKQSSKEGNTGFDRVEVEELQ